jgi:other hect domain ubiquitin protein ligase E3
MTKILKDREQERLHHLQTNAIDGVISIAKYISFVNLTEFYSSLTVDNNGYLYLWVSIPQRGTMYKIGSGEAGTIAGRVYLHSPVPDREGEVTWVFCQDKLYARRVNEAADLGHLLVFDPLNFKLEGTAKINITTTSQNQ